MHPHLAAGPARLAPMSQCKERLSRDAIARIVQERFAEEVLSLADVADCGTVNQVVVVRLASSTVVLRTNDGSNRYEFDKEALCLAEARARGIPGPRVLVVGQLDGCAYMVEEFIPTVAGQAAPCPDELWRTLGRYARIIHGIPVSGFGRDLAGAAQLAFVDTWARFLAYNRTSLTRTDPLLDLGFSREDSRRLAALFERLAGTDVRLGLCHGDLAPRNTVVAESGRVFLLDWGCAQVNVVPHFDVGEVLRSEVSADSAEFAALLDGYGMTRAEFDNQAPDRAAIMALCRADLLRWAIDRAPESIPHYASQLRRALDEACRHT